jgi:hypothetical protein
MSLPKAASGRKLLSILEIAEFLEPKMETAVHKRLGFLSNPPTVIRFL